MAKADVIQLDYHVYADPDTGARVTRLTPPDVISQFMLAIPLMLLYELGIYLAGFIAARSRAPDDPDAATPTPEVPTKTD